MCVLAGCDFLPSISGIGTKRAYSLVSRYKNIDRVRMPTLLLISCYSENKTLCTLSILAKASLITQLETML